MPSLLVTAESRLSRDLGREWDARAKGLYTHAAIWRLPRFACVLVLGWLVLPMACKTPLSVRKDAGTGLDLPSPDLALADLQAPSDPRPDSFPDAFADVPGHTFQIAASATPPDASAPFNSACKPSDPQAIYDLIFSADGTKVHIVRADPVQEVTMDGTLQPQSDAGLVYAIDNGWAGAELAIRRDNGILTAQLSVFGSGVPVVSCIESPMAVQ